MVGDQVDQEALSSYRSLFVGVQETDFNKCIVSEKKCIQQKYSSSIEV